MPFIDALPAATSVSTSDLIIVAQGGTSTPGTATTRSAMVSQLPSATIPAGSVGDLIGATGTAGVSGVVTIGANMSLSGGVLSATPGAGGVSSVVGAVGGVTLANLVSGGVASTAALTAETTRAEAAEALLLPKAGVTNGSNAASGQIGECISSTVVVGSAVALTSGTAANVTSISLTAGDWDVWGNVGFNPGGSTTFTALDGWINTVSAAGPTFPNGGAAFGIQAPLTTGAAQLFPIGMMRINVTATTTVYLGALASFGAATLAAFGFIGARRAR